MEYFANRMEPNPNMVLDCWPAMHKGALGEANIAAKWCYLVARPIGHKKEIRLSD